MQSVALPVQTGWVTVDGGSFVLSEPDGSANFYPVNDHPLDKATYTFRVTVPDPLEVAANGVLIETMDNGDTTTFIFEARDPMASYLATINIDEFEIETMQSENGIPIRNYYSTGLPQMSASRLRGRARCSIISAKSMDSIRLKCMAQW